MKVLKGWRVAAFLLLLTVVLAGAFTRTVSAENPIPEDNILVDYETETITVETNDKIVYYTDVYYTDLAKWNACEVRDGQAAFDISWVPDTKNVRLYVCGDVNKEVVGVDLVWKETLRVKFVGSLLSTDITEAEDWKAAYEATGTDADGVAYDYLNFSEDTGYFIFTLLENDRDTAYFNLDNIEWRKGSEGVWRPFYELDLKEMNIRGIKLDFRVKSSQVTTFAVYGGNGTRPSTIASVTVQKLGSAPIIDVNSDTMTINVRNGLEYSLDKEKWILIPAYSKKLGMENYKVSETERADAISKIYTVEKIAKLSVQEVLGLDLNAEMVADKLGGNGLEFAKDADGNVIGIKLYVRTAGDEKKAASKITELIIPFAADGKSVAQKNDLTIYHGESKTATGGIVVENTSNVKYQVGVLTPAELVDKDGIPVTDNTMDQLYVDTAKVKWTSLREGRLMKFANSKVPEGSYLIYRIAGEDGYLPSTYVLSDKITYDTNTYAGISYTGKNVGNVLNAVASTNKRSGNVSYQWQRCTDIKAENVTWDNIAGATEATYTTTDADANAYIRVVITYKGETRESTELGPIKLIK